MVWQRRWSAPGARPGRRARIPADREIGLDAPALRHEAVALLDAPHCVASVGAHVPLADLEATASGIEHPTERLVAEDQPLPTGERPCIPAVRDLDAGPADTYRQGFDEYRSRTGVPLGDILNA
jgi:hypothetical protein